MLAVRRDGVGALAYADDRVHKQRCAGEPGRPPCAAATGRPPLPLTALLRSGSSCCSQYYKWGINTTLSLAALE